LGEVEIGGYSGEIKDLGKLLFAGTIVKMTICL
jgi:hypothetical protein